MKTISAELPEGCYFFKISSVMKLLDCRSRITVKAMIDHGKLKAVDLMKGIKKPDGTPAYPQYRITRASLEAFIQENNENARNKTR
jgi:hypothetical protein